MTPIEIARLAGSIILAFLFYFSGLWKTGGGELGATAVKIAYNKVNIGADWFAKSLRQVFKSNVLGPEFPPISRIRNQYHKNILVKIPQQHSLRKTKSVHKGSRPERCPRNTSWRPHNGS